MNSHPLRSACTPARTLALIVLLLGTAQAAQAAGPTIFFSKERDLASLSPACQARLGDKTSPGYAAQYANWEQQLTPEIFFHFHHHCFGLFDMKKALTGIGIDKSGRMALYRDAVTQFDYVLKRWPKTHPLYKEAEQYRAEALKRLGRSN